MTTFLQKRPLALVIDDKYVWFPYDLASKGCTYAVLGFYRIANVWGKSGSHHYVEYLKEYSWLYDVAEKQFSTSANEYVVRYKLAFQWCDEQGEPWWISESDPCPTAPGRFILSIR